MDSISDLTWGDLPCQALVDTESREEAQEHIRGCSTCQAADTVLECGPDGDFLTVNIKIE